MEVRPRTSYMTFVTVVPRSWNGCDKGLGTTVTTAIVAVFKKKAMCIRDYAEGDAVISLSLSTQQPTSLEHHIELLPPDSSLLLL